MGLGGVQEFCQNGLTKQANLEDPCGGKCYPNCRWEAPHNLNHPKCEKTNQNVSINQLTGLAIEHANPPWLQ